MKMNPTDPASFNHRTERLSTGRAYHFVDQQPASQPDNESPGPRTILCVHGFPDIWYGWRHQIGPWVRAGYRVLAPDMLGYGGTDKPLDAAEYSTKKLCADLAALLDIVGVSRAIVIGHDWGSEIAGRFALWHPDRLLALGFLSTPFTPPTKQYNSLEDVVRKVPNYAYQLYFADPESTKEIEADLERFVRLIFAIEKSQNDIMVGANMREAISGGVTRFSKSVPVLTNNELQYVTSQLRSMNGPLSYYRTTKIRFEDEQAARLPSHLPAGLPVLYIWGAKDPTARPRAVSAMREMIAGLEVIELPDQGHWIMAGAKDEVTRTVLKWLAKSEVEVKARL